jgi:hypothetical protein
MSAETSKENGIWLTDHVHAALLKMIETQGAGDTRQ